MDDSLLESLAQSLLEGGGCDYPLTNGDIDFSLPPELTVEPPPLESLSNDSSGAGKSSSAEAGRVGDDFDKKHSFDQSWLPAGSWLSGGTASQLREDALGSQPAQRNGLLPGSLGSMPLLSQLQQQSEMQDNTFIPQTLLQQQQQANGLHARSGVDADMLSNQNSGNGSSEGHTQSSEILPRRQGSDEHDRNNTQSIIFKEKNRAAQRRYRERQKEKLQASEQRVAELTEQLQKMQSEQRTLTQRNVMLEKLLAMQQTSASQQPTPTGGRAAIEAEKDAWWLDDQMKVFMEEAFFLSGELLFTVRPDGPLRMTQEQVASMSEQEFDTLWKEYMNAYAVLLIEAEGDPNTAPGRRLSRLVHEGGQLKASMIVSYPDRLHYKMACSRQDKHSDDVWRSLVDSARMSDEQKRAIVGMRGTYLRNLGLLSRRRQELTTLLQAELPMSGACNGPTLASDAYSRTLSTMDSLRDTLRDEHTCLLQFTLTVWRRVFTPMQVAHINVASYPGHANIMRIAEVLAQQAGEPMSCAVMAAGAAEPQGTRLVPIDRSLPRNMCMYTMPTVDLRVLYPHLPLEQLHQRRQRKRTGDSQGPGQQPDTPESIDTSNEAFSTTAGNGTS